MLRRAALVAGFERRAPRPHGADRSRPRCGRPRGRCYRPARLRPVDSSRPCGHRHRDRAVAALRCPDGLRWSPCRIHRDQASPRQSSTRPPRRRQHRYCRQACAAARAPDTRTAHPPREGDLEHLHRPGAPRQHGRLLRCLAWSQGFAADRRARTPADIHRGVRSARSGHRGHQQLLVRHRSLRRALGRSRDRSGESLRDRTAQSRRSHDRLHVRRDIDGGNPHPRVEGDGLRRAGRRPRVGRRGDLPNGAADRRDPEPFGVQPVSQRTRDAALPAPSRRQGSRPGPNDDPTRFVHDEAQRNGRDDADHVARVRQHSPLRRPLRYRGLPRDDRPAGADARCDHGLRRRQPAAQCRQPGRVRRPARNPQLSRQPRRSAAHDLSHPVERPWHECGERRHGRNERRRRCLRRTRQHRPPRSAHEGRPIR